MGSELEASKEGNSVEDSVEERGWRMIPPALEVSLDFMVSRQTWDGLQRLHTFAVITALSVQAGRALQRHQWTGDHCCKILKPGSPRWVLWDSCSCLTMLSSPQLTLSFGFLCCYSNLPRWGQDPASLKPTSLSGSERKMERMALGKKPLFSSVKNLQCCSGVHEA